MKLLLISANMAASPYPVYPLGRSMVAAALRTAGHEVALFDFLQQGQSLEALAAALRQEAPALIGISIRNIDNVNLLNEQRYLDAVRDIIRTIRAATAAPVVLGGSGFSVMPEALLRELGADYGVVGEGEAVFTDFVAQAARGVFPAERLLRSRPQLAGRAIPSAAYDPAILSFYLQSGHMASVQTKRGCTHHCVYCTYPVLEGQAIRPRDPEAVVDDVQTLVGQHQAKYVFFTDSVFNDDDGHYLDVVRAMQRRGICTPWTAFFKPDPRLTDEIVELMKSTGLKAAELGSDAPSDATLRGLGKSFTFREVDATNSLFLNHGVATAHYFMFGGPGETPDTVREGIANIASLRKTAIFVFMGIRILPGTPLEAVALREGVIAPGQPLLDPIYYLSPQVDRQWLEATLTEAFAKLRHVVFPPDALDRTLQFLFKLGYTGSLWDMLVEPRSAHRREKRHGAP